MCENGANVNAFERDGWTALMIASHAGDEEMVSLLIEYGASSTHVANDGISTALGVALRQGNRDIVQRLLISVMTDALITGDGPAILKALADGASPNSALETGWTPLIFMVTHNDLTGAQAVLDSGADVNMAENDGWSPVMMAADSGNIEMVKLLLENGADAAQQAQRGPCIGCTALSLANNAGHVAIVKLLKNIPKRPHKS